MRCKAIIEHGKRAGHRCTNKALAGSEYCGRHRLRGLKLKKPESSQRPHIVSPKAEKLIAHLTKDGSMPGIVLDKKLLHSLAGLSASSSANNIEMGGLIDVEPTGVERTIYEFDKQGRSGAVDLRDYQDYEVTFHTHPFRNPNYLELPSLEDIMYALYTHYDTVAGKVRRVHLVLAPDAIYSIYVTKFAPFPKELNGRELDAIAHRGVKFLSHEHFDNLHRVYAAQGIVIMRHTRATVGPYTGEYKDLLRVWPEKLTIYVDPQTEAVTAPRVKLTRDHTLDFRKEYDRLERLIYSHLTDVDRGTIPQRKIENAIRKAMWKEPAWQADAIEDELMEMENLEALLHEIDPTYISLDEAMREEERAREMSYLS